MTNKPNPIVRMIEHACVAGSCRVHARRHPGAAPGLLKCADLHSRRAAEIASHVARAPRMGGA